MSLLEIRDLISGYQKVPIIQKISIHLEEKEILTIVGSNGAGKTTLLKTISGLIQLWGGEILFERIPLQGLEPHQIVARGIAQVPEGRQLFGYLTVGQNLQVGSHLNEARKKRQETLQTVFDLFPVLADRQKQLASTLSGGEQQMLATARALMARPKLLMMDEPSWGLAPLAVRRLFETICQVNQKGCTILLVEQQVHHALSIAKRAYVLERGNVVMEGGGKELLSDPRLKESYLGL
jgi:branched-chain amino acid transport system ATP-binding protein